MMLDYDYNIVTRLSLIDVVKKTNERKVYVKIFGTIHIITAHPNVYVRRHLGLLVLRNG